MTSQLSRRTSPWLFFRQESTHRRNLTVSALILLTTAAATFAGRSFLAHWANSSKEQAGEPVPVVVQVTTLAPEVVETGLRYSGLVQELRKVELSFRVPGTIDELLQFDGPHAKPRDVHDGDTAVEGTVLARLDTADYERDRALAAQKLATAQARLAQAQAEAQLSRRELERNEQLYQRKVVSDADHDAAVSRVKSTTAAEQAIEREVDACRIQLEQSEANLGYCSLTVPFPVGTIAARRIDRQQRVAAHQTAFLVLDLSSLVIRFSVPDSLVGQLRIGQTVAVTSDALPGQTFAGAIHLIASSADPQTKTYPIEVRIDHPDGLKPGMVAAVQFRDKLSAHLLPLTAIASSSVRGQFIVYRVMESDGAHVVEEVPVESEAVLDNRVAIRLASSSGLQPGDRVVKSATHRLHAGQAVRIAE